MKSTWPKAFPVCSTILYHDCTKSEIWNNYFRVFWAGSEKPNKFSCFFFYTKTVLSWWVQQILDLCCLHFLTVKISLVWQINRMVPCVNHTVKCILSHTSEKVTSILNILPAFTAVATTEDTKFISLVFSVELHSTILNGYIWLLVYRLIPGF